MSEIIFKSARHPYPVRFHDTIASVQRAVERKDTILALTDQVVYDLYPEFFSVFADRRIIVSAGEISKSIDSVQEIAGRLAQFGADRQSVLVAIGGGVIGDLGGFVASVWMRGIRHIHVPTTLLAMTDSSLGGKTGINHPLGKNLMGTIWPPVEVHVCPAFLRTLPEREIVSGMAEVVKYGLIADTELFETIERSDPKQTRDDAHLLSDILFRSALTKKQIVELDEHESHWRMLLNFGHTFAHALESLSHYELLTHGEAVFLGMRMAAVASPRLSDADRARIDTAIRRVAGPFVQTPSIRTFLNSLSSDRLWQFMTFDKKASRQRPRLILLEKIGKAYIQDDVSQDSVTQAFESIRESI